jgi:acetyltransferase
MGIYRLPDRLNGTYFWELPRRAGNLAFVSQSGAYGGMLFGELRRRAMGISTFVSIGNQADITHADILEFLETDPTTEVVALFVEEVRNGPRFLAAARRLAAKKAVIAFKVGRTGAGRRAAQSHTGSMAGDYEVARAALRQAGVVVASDTDEFFDALAAYSAYPRGLGGGGLGIVTISGGPCVAAADACEESGVPAPVLRPATQERVRALIPEFGASHNPVDMTPQMDVAKMAACVEAVAGDPGISALLAINVGLDRPEFAAAFARMKGSKPVLAFTVDAPKIAEGFAAAGIPMFSTPERAARAYALLARGPRPAPTVPTAARAGTPLDPFDSARLLAKAGIPSCRQKVARTPAEAKRIAAGLGFPVVLKALRAGPHKSRRGGVELGVTAAALAAAYRRLAKNFGPEVVVQETVAGGQEILLGAHRDATFGPVVMAGGGGVWTEMMRDVAIRIAPIDAAEARVLIGETLAGRRLGPKGAGRVAGLIAALSAWVADSPEILEVDVNPVLVSEKRAVAVDALVVRRA